MHQKHQNRTIKTTISQQYTSFIFSFAKARSMDVTSVDRENTYCFVVMKMKLVNELFNMYSKAADKPG